MKPQSRREVKYKEWSDSKRERVYRETGLTFEEIVSIRKRRPEGSLIYASAEVMRGLNELEIEYEKPVRQTRERDRADIYEDSYYFDEPDEDGEVEYPQSHAIRPMPPNVRVPDFLYASPERMPHVMRHNKSLLRKLLSRLKKLGKR